MGFICCVELLLAGKHHHASIYTVYLSIHKRLKPRLRLGQLAFKFNGI